MKKNMTTNERKNEVLRRIISTADRVMSASSRYTNLASLDPDVELSFPQPLPLDLALPVDPVSVLRYDGISVDIANKISGLYSKFCKSLSDRLETNFQQTWSKLMRIGAPSSSTPLDELQSQMRSAYTSIYNDKSNSWLEDIRQRTRASLVESATTEDTDVLEGAEHTKSQQQTFNHNYLPVLETFFSEEQFPSRADKMFLAKKSGMTYKQIHVWFQNRRSRVKKLTIQKDIALVLSNQTDVEDGSTSEGYSSSRSSSFTLVNDEDVLKWDAPVYAFPAKYPPDFDIIIDPFPCRFGDFSYFPKSYFDRKPIMRAVHQEDIDIVALTGAFEKLSIGNNARSRVKKRSDSQHRPWNSCITARNLTGCDVMSPYTTRPLRAPLTSLIRNAPHLRELRPCILSDPQTQSCSARQKADGSTANIIHPTSSLAYSRAAICQASPLNQDSVSVSGSVPRSSPNKDDMVLPTHIAGKKPGLSKRVPSSRPKSSQIRKVKGSASGPIPSSMTAPPSLVLPRSSSSSSITSTSSNGLYFPSTPPGIFADNSFAMLIGDIGEGETGSSSDPLAQFATQEIVGSVPAFALDPDYFCYAPPKPSSNFSFLDSFLRPHLNPLTSL